MSSPSHSEWLSLLPTSGPFLSSPVLDRVFPQGLDFLESDLLSKVRLSYEEWSEENDAENPDPNIHAEWIRFIFRTVLGFTPDVMHEDSAIPSSLTAQFPEHQTDLTPDIAIFDANGSGNEGVRLLVRIYPPATDLESSIPGQSWAASPNERMKDHLRSVGVRLGLVTNGDRFTLVDAPEGETPAFVDFYANVWVDEPITLRAFASLLGARRFFAAAETDTLEAMLTESVQYQAEVTDQLGLQVRRAVEVLIQALDVADTDHGGQLLRDLEPSRLYEAALTVMMRLVFMFKAEESDLLPSGDELYEECFATSTLRARLREEGDRYGVEVLEHRMDAWPRLLAAARAIHGGVEHDRLSMPAYGGGLFDPDRFPFLEGRTPNTTWRECEATPLPIDNRTVLLLLEALQLLQLKGKGGSIETRKLSFRALDIEQIGHVYETLLDHDAFRADSTILGLKGSKGLEPEIALEILEELWDDEAESEDVVEFLRKETGRSASALENSLTREPDEPTVEALRVACGDDDELLERVLWFHDLIRTDPWGHPIVVRKGSIYVTAGTGRRSTGTYYTPKALTEEMVTYALEPLVYEGPSDGKPKEEWQLRSPRDLLELRICDPAMGSAAFLVQACRWLSERLIESWQEAGLEGDFNPDGEPIKPGTVGTHLVPRDPEEKKYFARRLVAERCLFGVDKNPMAVEMAKLSMWLVTMAKNRPFSFLDHNLRCGDSLLGITSLDQLENFHIDPERGKRIHDRMVLDLRKAWRPLIEKALAKRQELEAFPVWDPKDAEEKRRLLGEAEDALQPLRILADVIVGIALQNAQENDDTRDGTYIAVALEEAKIVGSGISVANVNDLEGRAHSWLDADLVDGSRNHRPLHWVLEFPEVFMQRKRGFDVIIGNPPFLGAPRISEVLGNAYNSHLANIHPPYSRRVDLCAHFFRTASRIVDDQGVLAFLATNSISEGNTRRGELDVLRDSGFAIFAAKKDFPWPGRASVIASAVCLTRRLWSGEFILNGRPVTRISPHLTSDELTYTPQTIAANLGLCFQGGTIWGDGFYLTSETAEAFLNANPRNGRVVRRALGGQELNAGDMTGSRWIIDFGEMEEEEASTFLEPYEHLQKTTREWRLGLDPSKYGRITKGWWKHFHARRDLYKGIESRSLPQVISRSRVSNHHILAFVPSDIFFLDAVIVLLFDDHFSFGVLQSVFHEAWIKQYSSRLKGDTRYGARNCFLPFPRPDSKAWVNEVASMCESYLEVRAVVMRSCGSLTSAYNAMHSRGEGKSALAIWREACVSLDQQVARAYGWGDLDLKRDFHETPEGWRYTVGAALRTEILDRLLELNHARYEEEVSKGLHGDVAKSPPPKLDTQGSSLF